MSFAEKHAKGGIDWGIDTKDFPYIDREDLFKMNGADEVYTLRGLFINRNKPEKQLKEFGASVVAIIDGKLINFPNHMLSEVEQILGDVEDVESIKDGKVGFKIETYESHAKTCYGVRWIDL